MGKLWVCIMTVFGNIGTRCGVSFMSIWKKCGYYIFIWDLSVIWNGPFLQCKLIQLITRALHTHLIPALVLGQIYRSLPIALTTAIAALLGQSVVIMPTLSSLMALGIVIMTTSSWRLSLWQSPVPWQSWHYNNSWVSNVSLWNHLYLVIFLCRPRMYIW